MKLASILLLAFIIFHLLQFFLFGHIDRNKKDPFYFSVFVIRLKDQVEEK